MLGMFEREIPLRVGVHPFVCPNLLSSQVCPSSLRESYPSPKESLWILLFHEAAPVISSTNLRAFPPNNPLTANDILYFLPQWWFYSGEHQTQCAHSALLTLMEGVRRIKATLHNGVDSGRCFLSPVAVYFPWGDLAGLQEMKMTDFPQKLPKRSTLSEFYK